jgi:hypothetical protein
MNNRFKGLNLLIIALFLLVAPLAGAYAACCSGHGGVGSCNKSTGYKMCKDGTASPTCTCPIKKAAKSTKKTKKAVVTTTTKSKKSRATSGTTKNTSTSPKKSSWWDWNGKSSNTKNTTKSNSSQGESARGCCSRHGGIAQCDRIRGYQMCKDGTQSPSCTCH